MTTSYWLTAVNGNWDTSSDWNSDSVPGEDDAVFINASGAPYSVDSTQSNEAGSLTLVSPATLIVDTNTHFTVFGNISNAGTIELNNQGTNNTYLIINTYTVTLTGGGFLMMTDSAGNNIQGNTGGGQFGNSLINANNTIEGAGTIGGDGLAIDNQAVIDATGSNNALIIDTQFNGNPNSSQPGTIDNTGTLEATGSGGLQIQDTAVNNVGGLIYADGGNVDLQDAFITGGTLETSNGGSIDVVDGSSTLDGTGGNIVDNTGTVDVEY
jgi:hypothetical protein